MRGRILVAPAVMIAAVVVLLARWITDESTLDEFEGSRTLVVSEAGVPRRALSGVEEIIAPGGEDRLTGKFASNRRAGLRFIGCVVDARRHPRAATIDLLMEEHAAFSGSSTPDGGFEIATDLPIAGLRRDVTARAYQGADWGGTSSVQLGPWTIDPVDLGVIVLRDEGRVVVRALRDGRPLPGACLLVGIGRSSILGPFRTDEDGLPPPVFLDTGAHHLVVLDDSGRRGEADVQMLRASDEAIDVDLLPAWDLAVTVLDGATGEPMRGVRLRATSTYWIGKTGSALIECLTSRSILPTDASGRSVLHGLSRELPVVVSIIDDGFEDLWAGLREEACTVTAKPGEEEVVLRLPVGETFSFPIAADESPIPAEGSLVRLSLPPGYGGVAPPKEGRVVGGVLVVDRVPEGCFNILAKANDGSMAIVRLLGDARKTGIGSEARFKKPRSLEVRVRDASGRIPPRNLTPVEGHRLHEHRSRSRTRQGRVGAFHGGLPGAGPGRSRRFGPCFPLGDALQLGR